MAQQETSAIKVRQMTVYNKHYRRQSSASNQYKGNILFPIISLSGKWLQESGFRAGHVIDIVCEDGKLTVTIAKEQRFEGV
ncbi:MAG: SymE family type I addiction module toxin [Sediminibacterium sp.]